MNTYLLLRNNKQSGPYSVSELRDMGIKPYDLVWLEGKSAAWRYPSEVDELKAFSPIIEEQPFDRFYKKPAAEPSVEGPAKASPDHSRFEPPVVADAIPLASVPKRVYVNFPGRERTAPAQASRVVARQETVKEQPVRVETPAFSAALPMAAAEKREFPAQDREAGLLEQAEQFSMAYRQASVKGINSRRRQGLILAGFAVLVALSIFIINYSSQRQSIDRLNRMVQQMEQRDRQQAAAIPAVSYLPEEAAAAPGVLKLDPPADEPFAKGGANLSARSVASSPRKKSAAPVAVEQPAPVTEQPVVAKDPTPAEPAPVAPVISSADLYQQVLVKANKYKTGVLGGISNLELELTNNSTEALQRVAVEINYFGPEKKLVRTQTVHFENVAPGSQAVLKVPKSNRGISVEYRVTNILQ